MANSSINLINLDFNSFKQSFKDHLSTQTRFRDYDFDGSNMSVFLDVLAYNTYVNTFYMNMVASEMFLDSAQLRDSVVSHAKELNYIPRSFRSATANVNISITPSPSVDSVVIPRGTSFTGRLGSNSHNFIVDSAISLTTSSNGVFYSNNTIIYEGTLITDTFIKNEAITNQRFLITNPNVDTSSITVNVLEDSGSVNLTYLQAYNLYGIIGSSQVFFIQPAENNQYELIFGDNLTGRTPKNGSIINVSYRVCNGELPNGIDNFVNNSSIDGHSNVAITVVSAATAGAVSESIDSIKYNAPRSFQTQERAITENDYKILLLREFPEIAAISVYGGEKADPPQYGKVFIALDISNADIIPEGKKTNYQRYLSDKIPLSTVVSFVEPSYIYLGINSDIKYNYSSTNLSENQLKTIALNSIIDYSNLYLSDFNINFKYSNFLQAIDNSDPSFLNNDTDVYPYVELVPIIGTDTSFVTNFNTPILITTPSTSSHNIIDDRGVYSSSFTYGNYTCALEDDGLGNMRIVRITTTEHITLVNVGTVDYVTGRITISNLNVSAISGTAIKLYINPVNHDFSVTKQTILKIRPEDITVRMTPVKS